MIGDHFLGQNLARAAAGKTFDLVAPPPQQLPSLPAGATFSGTDWQKALITPEKVQHMMYMGIVETELIAHGKASKFRHKMSKDGALMGKAQDDASSGLCPWHDFHGAYLRVKQLA